jgi:hypothetical protein
MTRRPRSRRRSSSRSSSPREVSLIGDAELQLHDDPVAAVVGQMPAIGQDGRRGRSHHSTPANASARPPPSGSSSARRRCRTLVEINVYASLPLDRATS